MTEDTYRLLTNIAQASDGITGWSKREMMRQARRAVEKEDQHRHDEEVIQRAVIRCMEVTRRDQDLAKRIREVEEFPS